MLVTRLIRCDVEARVLLLAAMIEGVLSKTSDPAARAAAATRALALIVDGVTARTNT